MSLDIRIPIGLLFGIIGAILLVYGRLYTVESNPQMYLHSLGFNVNFWWGAVLLAFGLMMLGLAQIADVSGKKGSG
jgi:drug/metabolite transporter (DMT)-like permease